MSDGFISYERSSARYRLPVDTGIVEPDEIAWDGLTESVTSKSPTAPPDLARLEDIVAAAWSKALRGKTIDRNADFRELNMSPNRAMQILLDIWSATSIDLPVNVFFEAPTIRRMAAAICDGSALVAPDLVLLRRGDDSAPLFLFPGHAGYLIHLTDLVRELDYSGAIYGIAVSGLDGVGPFHDRFELEAQRSLGIIRRAQRAGPFRLVGYSIGGVTALETARLIRRELGDTVFLGLIDTPQNDHSWPYGVWLAFLLRRLAIKIRNRMRRRAAARMSRAPAPGRPSINPAKRGTQVEYRFRNPRGPDYPYFSPYWTPDHTPNYSRAGEHVCRMKGLYAPTRYDGKVFFFASTGGDPLACDPEQIWPRYLPDAEWVRVPGNHVNTMFGRNVGRLAAEISTRLNRAAPPA
jgi:thioesterase domain-containing protein